MTLCGTTATLRRTETGSPVNLTRDLPGASVTGLTDGPIDRATLNTTTLARKLTCIPVATLISCLVTKLLN